jgi:hypothetical protein
MLKQLFDWEMLTEADGVDHPAQLLLALAMLDRKELGLDSTGACGVPAGAGGGPTTPAAGTSSTKLSSTALYNLCNETLSRMARLVLKGSTDGSAEEMKRSAHQRVCQLLSVAPDSAPKPTAVEEPEPEIEVIAEACDAVRPSYQLTEGAATQSAAFCAKGLHGTLQCVSFAEVLQQYALNHGGMEALMCMIEMGCDDELVAHMVKAMSVAASQDIPTALSALTGVAWNGMFEAQTVLAAMEAQAFVYHSSGLRKEGLGDVRDSGTLHSMATDARLGHYQDALAVKRREWNKIAGDVTARRAMECDDSQFVHLIGSHAHRFTRQEFWSLARHAKRAGGARLEAFLATCNGEFCGGHGWLVL